MPTIEQIADVHGGLPIEKIVDGGIDIGGVFVGRKIGAGVFAEKVMEARWTIRSTRPPMMNPARVGEVLGRNGRFVACLTTGENVGITSSLRKAADLLVNKRFG